MRPRYCFLTLCFVQVVRLYEVTEEAKQRAGDLHNMALLGDDITHEGYISDGEHCLHAWFHRQCFRRSRVNGANAGSHGKVSTVVHYLAVFEITDWWYHRTDALPSDLYSGSVEFCSFFCPLDLSDSLSA